MKTRIGNMIRRAFAKWKMRSLEIDLHGMNEAMQYVQDEETRIRISLARERARRALVIARAEYLALLPAGERQTFVDA